MKRIVSFVLLFSLAAGTFAFNPFKYQRENIACMIPASPSEAITLVSWKRPMISFSYKCVRITSWIKITQAVRARRA